MFGVAVAGAALVAGGVIAAPDNLPRHSGPVQTVMTESRPGWQSGLSGELGLTGRAGGAPYVSGVAQITEGRLVAVGSFSVAGTATSMAVFEPDSGKWVPVDGAPDTELNAVTVNIDGVVHVAGGGKIWRWSPITGILGEISSPGDVRSMEFAGNGILYAGGPFSGGVHSYDKVRDTWEPVGGGLEDVYELKVSPDGVLHAAGAFSGGVARLDPVTTAWDRIVGGVIDVNVGAGTGSSGQTGQTGQTGSTSTTSTTVPGGNVGVLESPEADEAADVNPMSDDTSAPAVAVEDGQGDSTTTTSPTTVAPASDVTTKVPPETQGVTIPEGAAGVAPGIDSDAVTLGSVVHLAFGPDGTMFAAGDFFGPSGVATFDGTQWVVIPGSPIGEVLTMAIGPDGQLYVGGTFTEPGANIAKYNFIDKKWSALDAYSVSAAGEPIGTDGTVRAIVPIGATVTIAGDFTHAGGNAAEGVATYLASRAVWNEINPGGGGRDGGVVEISGITLDVIQSASVETTQIPIVSRSPEMIQLMLPTFDVPAELALWLGPIVGPEQRAVQKGPEFRYGVPPMPGVTKTLVDKTLSLKWDPVFGVSKYRVTVAGTTSIVTASEFTVSGLAPGARISSLVEACDTYGCGPGWSEETVVPLDPPDPEIGDPDDDSIPIGWRPVPGGEEYEIIDEDGDVIGRTPGTGFVDENLPPDTERLYRVSACTANGVCTPSRAITGRTLSAQEAALLAAGGSAGVGGDAGAMEDPRDPGESPGVTPSLVAPPGADMWKVMGLFMGIGGFLGAMFALGPVLRRRRMDRRSRREMAEAGADR